VGSKNRLAPELPIPWGNNVLGSISQLKTFDAEDFGLRRIQLEHLEHPTLDIWRQRTKWFVERAAPPDSTADRHFGEPQVDNSSA
jgi:hypothetical protein